VHYWGPRRRSLQAASLLRDRCLHRPAGLLLSRGAAHAERRQVRLLAHRLIQTALRRGKKFRVDPNGYVVAVKPAAGTA